MTSQRAAALRDLIDSLAAELAVETNEAAIRCLKLAIRAAEFELSGS
jgi:hypothetical protein